jgi:disulfide bond formation protein DsbB
MCIYPQAVILGVALWKKEYSTALYSSLILSIIGILVAAYHYSLNVKKLLYPDMDFTPCDPSGVSCSDIPLLLYGYITIPFMTIVIMALVISTVLLALRTRK